MTTRSGTAYQLRVSDRVEIGNMLVEGEVADVGAAENGGEEQHLVLEQQRQRERRGMEGGVKELLVDRSERTEVMRMMDFLLEDKRQREAAQYEDRRRWEEEKTRREAEHEQHIRQMQRQLDMMQNLMERSQVREDELVRRPGEAKVDKVD